MLLPADKRPAIDEVFTLSWINQYRYHIIRLFETYEYDQNKFILEMQKLAINSQLVLTSTDPPPYKNFNWNDPILNSRLWKHQLRQLYKQSSISFDLSKKLVFGSEGLNSKSLIGNLKDKIYEVKFVAIYGKNEEEISYNLKLKNLEKNSILIGPDQNKKILYKENIDYADLLLRETKFNQNIKHKNIRECYGIFDIDYFSCFVSTL